MQYTYPPLPRVPLSYQASACSLSTLHFLNKLELMKILENKLELMKILKNKLESMKILENKLESLKLLGRTNSLYDSRRTTSSAHKGLAKLHMEPSLIIAV
ncbi:hypothetical protein Tco_0012844 [Tanacetum coccineum]